mmetsp:Transcript_17930/g.42887  ORF Transcript_17930/g.42887 Transcript_17930/m.42887 type:complete len:227 (-) Transcript_17930:329-1009(-)
MPSEYDLHHQRAPPPLARPLLGGRALLHRHCDHCVSLHVLFGLRHIWKQGPVEHPLQLPFRVRRRRRGPRHDFPCGHLLLPAAGAPFALVRDDHPQHHFARQGTLPHLHAHPPHHPLRHGQRHHRLLRERPGPGPIGGGRDRLHHRDVRTTRRLLLPPLPLAAEQVGGPGVAARGRAIHLPRLALLDLHQVACCASSSAPRGSASESRAAEPEAPCEACASAKTGG